MKVTSSPSLSNQPVATTGPNTWPYDIPENSASSGTVYQMDGVYIEGSIRGSKNSSGQRNIYTALELTISLILLNNMCTT